MKSQKNQKRYDQIEKEIYSIPEAAVAWSDLEEHKDEILSKVKYLPYVSRSTNNNANIEFMSYCRKSFFDEFKSKWPGLVDKFNKLMLGVDDETLSTGAHTPLNNPEISILVVTSRELKKWLETNYPNERPEFLFADQKIVKKQYNTEETHEWTQEFYEKNVLIYVMAKEKYRYDIYNKKNNATSNISLISNLDSNTVRAHLRDSAAVLTKKFTILDNSMEFDIRQKRSGYETKKKTKNKIIYAMANKHYKLALLNPDEHSSEIENLTKKNNISLTKEVIHKHLMEAREDSDRKENIDSN